LSASRLIVYTVLDLTILTNGMKCDLTRELIMLILESPKSSFGCMSSTAI
jgi:hypothetical protein